MEPAPPTAEPTARPTRLQLSRREWLSWPLGLHAGAVVLLVVPRGWLGERSDVLARLALAVLSGLDRLLVLPWSFLVGAPTPVLLLGNLAVHAGLLRLVRLRRARSVRAEVTALRGRAAVEQEHGGGGPPESAPPLRWPSDHLDAPPGASGAWASPEELLVLGRREQRRVDSARRLLWVPFAVWLLGTPLCLWVAFVFWFSLAGAQRPPEDGVTATAALLLAGACAYGAPVVGMVVGRRAELVGAAAGYGVVLGLSFLPPLGLVLYAASA